MLRAVLDHNLDVMKAVIALYPEHINFMGIERDRPLHLAVSQSSVSMVEWMINQRGINLALENGNNLCPLQLDSRSKIIDRMLVMKSMNPQLRDPICASQLDQYMLHSLFAAMSPPRTASRQVRRLSPTTSPAQEKKKARMRSPVKTIERDGLDKKGIKALLQTIYTERREASDDDVQWVLLNHRGMFFEYLAKADQGEGYLYLKQFEWLRQDGVDRFI